MKANARAPLACMLMLTVSTAATAAGANSPLEYVDEETGVTVTVVGRPLVFEHQRAAANEWRSDGSRDYVTLAAAAVDRAGKLSYLLIVYFWSVGVSEPSEPARLAREPLVFELQERRIELAPQGGSAREAGISAPVHRPSFGPVAPAVYAIDLPTMSLIAESAHPALYCGAKSAQVKYELFEDRLPALRELLRRLNDTN